MGGTSGYKILDRNILLSVIYLRQIPIITTTGYATTDYNQWPAVSRTILVLLTLDRKSVV